MKSYRLVVKTAADLQMGGLGLAHIYILQQCGQMHGCTQHGHLSSLSRLQQFPRAAQDAEHGESWLRLSYQFLPGCEYIIPH